MKTKIITRKVLYPLIALSVILSSSCGKAPANQSSVNLQQSIYAPLDEASLNKNLNNNTDEVMTAASVVKAEDLLKKDQEAKDDEKVITQSLFPKAPDYSGPVTLPSGVKKFDLQMKSEPEEIKKIFEPSALCFDENGNMFTIADKLFFSIYSLKKTSKGYHADDAVKMKTMQILKYRLKKKNRFDFEGLEYFNNLFYVSDERDRKVFTVDRQGNLNDLKIDINGYLKANGIRNNEENSGFEGLTIDPKNNLLFLTKERQEEAVLVVDLKTNKVIRHFKVNLPGNVEPALTDASFFDGNLYVLVRSHRQVLKLNPENGEVLSIYDYRHHEENPNYVYRKIPVFGSGNDPQGYGVMEGLAVTKDKIFVATDNNMLPLKKNIFNNHPQLFTFERPE